MSNNSRRDALDKGLERTFAEKLPGHADKQEGLGKPSKITPAKPPAPPSDPAAQMLTSLSTDLRAKSGAPTLAQRVVAEGAVGAYGLGVKAKK
jgi:hypothetical protein